MRLILSPLVAAMYPVALSAMPAIADTIHVDEHVNGGNQSGEDWANAMPSLQTALANAQLGDEVWVADGTYDPHPSSESTSFELESGVKIYGGFDGGATNEQNLSDRNLHQFEAILTGQINTASADDNSQHVVRAGVLVDDDFDEAIIDGFTIIAGYADGTGSDAQGGGMYLENKGKVIVANIIFKSDHAHGDGGGLFINSDGTTNHNIAIVNCTFIDNDADNGGGAWVAGRIEQVTNCAFAANIAFFEGGGLGNDSGYPIIVSQCSFSKNDAGAANTRRGSGLYCAPGPDAAVTTDDSTADIRNCIFWENGEGASNTWVTASTSNVAPVCGDVDGPVGWFYDLDGPGPYHIVNEVLPPGELCEGEDVAIQGLLGRGAGISLILVANCDFDTLKYGAHIATSCGVIWFDDFIVSVGIGTALGDTYGLRGSVTKVRWRNGSFANNAERPIVRMWDTVDGLIQGTPDVHYTFAGGQLRLGGPAGLESEPHEPLSNVVFRHCTITAENLNETVLELYTKTHHVTFQDVDFESNGGALATCHTSSDLQGQPVEPWAHDITFIDCTFNGTPINSTNLASFVNARGGESAQKIEVHSAPDEKEARQFYAPNNYLNSIVQSSNIEGLSHFDITGSGNIAVDPQFADPFSNLRLADCSPCIDAGDNDLIPGAAGATDIAGDAADLNYNTDLDEDLPNDGSLAPRVVDNPNVLPNGPPVVDMGAYEIPGCATPADLFPTCRPNCGFGDGFVGAGDLAELLANWGQNPANECADIFPIGAPDNNVGAGDLGELLSNWGNVPQNCGGEDFGGGDGPGSGDDSGYFDALDADPEFYEWALDASLDELMTWLETGDWGG